MRLKRISDGEYQLQHGEKIIQIMRGMDRRWTISPLEGVQFQDKEAESYAAAKKVGEKLLLAKTNAAGAVKAAKGSGDPVSAIQELRRNLDDLERSLSKT